MVCKIFFSPFLFMVYMNHVVFVSFCFYLILIEHRACVHVLFEIISIWNSSHSPWMNTHLLKSFIPINALSRHIVHVLCVWCYTYVVLKVEPVKAVSYLVRSYQTPCL